MPRLVLVAFFAMASLAAGLALSAGVSPEEAIRRMKPGSDFEVRLVAAEPVVRQPVTLTFDDRGRIWVIQYLQYPNPAGLKPVSVDQYLRTRYDRVPEPPPHGPRGADRVTILENPDASGRYQSSKDFVSGLNLASGMCLGHGGVFVLQVPYLLFYPDRDGDDIPDGPPEVLLSGFGMEDAHAVANSLQWGPDGWLYGAQGSTVTANIRGIEFQQGIWRYHPRTRAFELFSEGGGNTWGLDFDRHGHVIAGTNYGGAAMLHQVQGGYYVKGFAKHGPLHNPHTYGYFDHVPYKGFQGGHVTLGGVVYRGGTYPTKYHNQYVACNLLSNVLNWHALESSGSSFTSRHLGEFLAGNDFAFRAVDCLVGPDGNVHVADWYDVRANHVDPVDNWDKATGRIYKVLPKVPATTLPMPSGWKDGRGPSLSRLTSAQLIDLLKHPNDWFRREARRLLAERRDPSVAAPLKKILETEKGEWAVEALWALYVSGGFNESFGQTLLNHSSDDVRTWTVRLLCDEKRVSPEVAIRLTEMARREGSPQVRSQLACSAKRLPTTQAIPMIRELLRRQEDVNDPHLPMLLWWAIESKAISDREQVLGLLDTPEAWRVPMVRRMLLERLGRRFLAEGNTADLAACARLLSAAPGPEEVRLLIQGMEKALDGRMMPRVPQALEASVAALWGEGSRNPLLVRFALRLGSPQAYERALALAADPRIPEGDRISLLDVLGQAARPDALPTLLQVFAEGKGDAVRSAALSALQSYAEPTVADAVLARYAQLPGGLRTKAQTMLCSRLDSARKFFEAVEAGKVSPKEVPLDTLRRAVEYKDAGLQKIIEKHWGKVGPLPPGEKIARIRAINHSLNQRPGDQSNGKALFTKHCATCHMLFNEGNKVGPDLSGADRKNREFLLTSLVDPNAYIRPEYVAYVATLKDGRSLTGLLVEQSPQAVTLLNEKNERLVLARTRIEELEPARTSLMPEKILDPLSEQEIRDLFRYLQSDPPATSK